jgi:hypothetical protein
MTREQEEPLLKPECVWHPGFLWFKHRRHEPLERLYPTRGTSVFHVRYSSITGAGRTEHYVAVVCKHCQQPYFEVYNWREQGRIEWRGWDEDSPPAANRKALEAFERWQHWNATDTQQERG